MIAPIQQNPILDEIDQAHQNAFAGLSSPAKQALMQVGAHPDSEGVGMTGATGAAPVAHPSAIPAMQPPNLQGGEMQMPTGNEVQSPSMAGIPGKPETPQASELHRLQSTGSGVSQVLHGNHNPLLKGLAVAGDIASSFFPNIGMLTPGTTLHHQLLVSGQRRAVGDEQAAATADLTQQQQRAATAHTQAQTAQLNQPVEEDPETQAFKHFTGQGMDPASAYGKIIELKNGGKVAKEGNPELQAYDALLKKGIDPVEALHQVKAAGQAEKPEQADARYEGILAKQLQGQKLTPEETAQKQAYERRKLLVPSAQNTFRIENSGTKQDTATRGAAFKVYQPALDSAERFNVMAKNYEDAIKNHDQQAMLSLLANHLGMTMGLQKGARMTKDIIQQAEHSRPWLQGLKARFSDDGILSGVTLTPEQMRQMVNLGRERFAEDISKSGNEAKYLGANDGGPERTPNRSVINHYIALAGGDAAKAKDLAARDGWTVK